MSVELLGYFGNLVGAKPYTKRALTIREKILGGEHPDTANSLNNLGYLLGAMGDLTGARPYYERALYIREKVLGSEHPDTALSLNNMGRLLQRMGDLAGARPYYERALAINEKVLGGEHLEHPDTINIRFNLRSLDSSFMQNLASVSEHELLAQGAKMMGIEQTQLASLTGMLMADKNVLAWIDELMQDPNVLEQMLSGGLVPHDELLKLLGGLWDDSGE